VRLRRRSPLSRPALLVLLAAAVLLLHLLLIGGWPRVETVSPAVSPSVATGAAVRAPSVRLAAPTTALAPPPRAAVTPLAEPVQVQAQLTATDARRTPAAGQRSPRPVSETAVKAPSPVLEPTTALSPTPLPVALAAPVVAAVPAEPPTAEPSAAAVAPPVYDTRPPGPRRWTVRLQRGGLAGEGELVWSPREGGYALSLDGRVGPLPVLDWRSSGRLGPHGLAPERFVDKRRGRGAQAANFDAQQARITYSGQHPPQPLPAGAQDRLSVLLQLAAIVAADPSLNRPGAHVDLWVSGARGDADLWRFVVEGPDSVDQAGGAVPALRLHREPRHGQDLRVQLWLAASGDPLPLRMTLTPVAGGDALDLLLQPQ
jgi:hypothetical protein